MLSLDPPAQVRKEKLGMPERRLLPTKKREKEWEIFKKTSAVDYPTAAPPPEQKRRESDSQC